MSSYDSAERELAASNRQLRHETTALTRATAEAEAKQEQAARIELLEAMYDLHCATADLRDVMTAVEWARYTASEHDE